MAKTVKEAFTSFLENNVNLDSGETNRARRSKDWLLDQIHLFPSKDIWFPKLYSEKDISFGSFARCTKKRPLDDIDMMVALNGDGGSYLEFTDRIEIYVHNPYSRLRAFCFKDTNVLNSRKVINKFVSLLSGVPQYEKAMVKRNMEAATLNLSSYSWVFDLVPCFFTAKDMSYRDYYLIPDGQGYWKKTDPRIDRQRVRDVNQYHDGNVLNVIRLMKYWNRRATMPSMSSYLIENMILDFYSSRSAKASSFVDLEVSEMLKYIQIQVYHPVSDPKGIQGDINSLNSEEKDKISKRAYYDYIKTLEAKLLKSIGDHKASIDKWSEVLGSKFSMYE